MSIDEIKAKELIEIAKDKNIVIRYIGIEKVPYQHIENSYKIFPDELKNKEVFTFSGLNETKLYEAYRYYVDFNGNIYKDSYPHNSECIKIK